LRLLPAVAISGAEGNQGLQSQEGQKRNTTHKKGPNGVIDKKLREAVPKREPEGWNEAESAKVPKQRGMCRGTTSLNNRLGQKGPPHMTLEGNKKRKRDKAFV